MARGPDQAVTRSDPPFRSQRRVALPLFVRRLGVGPLLVTAACASAGGGGRIAPATPPDSLTASVIGAERGMAAGSGRTLAVPPFRQGDADSTLAPLAYAIADFLATDLSRSARLRLVERARLGELLRELDLASAGRVDSATAPRVGRLVQAQQLVLGALDPMGDGQLRLSVRIADVQSGRVEQALDARAPLADILAAEKAIAFRLFDALGVTLTPAERAQVEKRPSASVEAVSAYGRGVQAELSGDAPRASTEFQRALRLDPTFRMAGERAADVQRRATTASATLIPGIRGLDAPVAGVVDRLNRPLDLITLQSRPIPGPGDPSFPTTMVTVVIVVRRP